MVMLLAVWPGRTGAPQIETQHAIPAVEQMTRGTQDVGTVLPSGEPVNKNHERLAVDRHHGSVEHSQQDVTAAICHGERYPLALVRGDIA